MLQRLHKLIHEGVDFAFETTLATKSYVHIIKEAKKNNYEITLLFFYLNTPTLAIERVKQRVANGGHHIPAETIERRYKSGLQNFFRLYISLADNFVLCDNSTNEMELIIKKISNKEIDIYNSLTWQYIIHNNEK